MLSVVLTTTNHALGGYINICEYEHAQRWEKNISHEAVLEGWVKLFSSEIFNEVHNY